MLESVKKLTFYDVLLFIFIQIIFIVTLIHQTDESSGCENVLAIYIYYNTPVANNYTY